MSQLVSGTRIGSYEIVSQLGVGGMGEVYRATDTRLKRQVAIKVLPAALVADPDRLARFQREAEVLASLNHPNIAGLYGLEESDGVKALVMELVEGPTLAERIAQGPIPLDEAVTIARQIAEALEAAHDQNIIHRDLKPANIKLRPDGAVKVLDFGLAKALEQGSGIGDRGSGSLANSPTITSPAMTMHGVILGTAAYMSPEQAAGRAVDRRTDLWAFGVVLMEMLTGRQVFAGESVTDVIAAVLKDEPDWKALPASLPSSIQRLLRRCLERDRKKRWPDAATARMECDDALTAADDRRITNATPVPRSSVSPWRIAVSVIAGAIIMATIGWARWPSPQPPPESSRFAIDLPVERQFTRAGRHLLAISPDGMQLVYVANRRLFLHSFRTLESREVQGTENVDPSEPVFSPDNAWIAFWSDGEVRKIPAGGGSAVKLVEALNPLGLSWSGDQIVVGQPHAVLQVSADGTQSKTIVTIDLPSGEWIQSPQLIDHGRAVVFTQRTKPDDWNSADIVAQDLASGQRATLVKGGTDGRVLPGGVLLYARENALFAIRFDEASRAVSGETLALEHDVMPSVGGFTGASQVSASASGSLAYAVDSTAAESDVVWLTRQGKTEPTNLPPARYYTGSHAFAISPDGTRIAARMVGVSRSQTDIWIGDLARGTFARLTSTGSGTDPVWTPDGSKVCYRTNPFDLDCQPFDGSAPSAKLLTLDNLSTITDISRNGAWLLLSLNGVLQSGADIWFAANRAPFAPTPLLNSPVPESQAVLSPDGRWIAYSSEESGREQVFVRPFPNVHDARWQASPAGGTAPRWSRDGRELYYLSTASGGAALKLTLTAVPVESGHAFASGTPVAVGQLLTGLRAYDVAPDGRFLINQAAGGSGTTQSRIVVVRNWLDAVNARLSIGSTQRF